MYIYIYIYIHNSNNLSSCIIRDYVIIVIHSPNVSLCSRSALILSKTIKMIYLYNRIITYSFVTRGLLRKE